MRTTTKIGLTITLVTVFALSFFYYLTSSNYAARKLGGTLSIKLEPNQELINVTWKETELWYLTKPMDDDYKPTKKIFQEQSQHGLIEGKVIFIESKQNN